MIAELKTNLQSSWIPITFCAIILKDLEYFKKILTINLQVSLFLIYNVALKFTQLEWGQNLIFIKILMHWLKANKNWDFGGGNKLVHKFHKEMMGNYYK